MHCSLLWNVAGTTKITFTVTAINGFTSATVLLDSGVDILATISSDLYVRTDNLLLYYTVSKAVNGTEMYPVWKLPIRLKLGDRVFSDELQNYSTALTCSVKLSFGKIRSHDYQLITISVPKIYVYAVLLQLHVCIPPCGCWFFPMRITDLAYLMIAKNGFDLWFVLDAITLTSCPLLIPSWTNSLVLSVHFNFSLLCVTDIYSLSHISSNSMYSNFSFSGLYRSSNNGDS